MESLIEKKKGGRKAKERLIVEGVRFCETHSLESLSKGDVGDPNGKIFVGASMHDLTGVEVVGCSVDTVRQLYAGTVRSDRLQAIQKSLESKDRLFGGAFLSPLSHIWHVTKMGMASGYRYKLQNNDVGMVILFGSYYRSEEIMLEERGPHVKIEFSPRRIAEAGTLAIQAMADACASWFFEDGDWEHSGVAVHLAADVQGWEPDAMFKERFRSKARSVRDFDGITHLEFEGLHTVAVSYGKKAVESFCYGKHTSLQTCIYNKSLEVVASDKKDFFEAEWEVYSFGKYDKAKPVWRIEYRFHHSVIASFAESVGKPLKSFVELAPILTDLWRFALLRIPHESGHRFRRKLDSESSTNWTRIPRQTGRLK